MRRLLLPLALVVLAAVVVVGLSQAGGEAPGRQQNPSLAEQQRALAGAPPPLARLYARGNTIERGDLEARLRGLRGYPVVLNKWASWCGPCKAEFPAFAQAARQVGTRVAFLGVNAMDSGEAARRFLARQPVPYPSIEDVDGDVAQRLGLGQNFPVTAFFDRRGELVGVRQGGYASSADLLADIRRYLGG